jgi:hypothetical protein
MKTMRNLLLVGIAAAFCCSIGNAQIIYSNDFTIGSGNIISGTSVPTVANTFAGGSSSATWRDALGTHDTNSVGTQLYWGADGTVPGTPNSLLLPFSPQSGNTYLLTATVTFTGNPGSWVGLGFGNVYSLNALWGYGRFSDSGNNGPNGQDWMIATESSGNVQTFHSRNGQDFNQNGFFTAGPQTLTLQVLLDTTTTLWTKSVYVGGVQAGTTYAYTANPTINSVGITENSLSTPGNVQWDNITLAVVPEPSVLALIGAGLTMLFLVTLCRNRRRDMAGKTLV